MRGFSHSVSWYLTIQAFVSQYGPSQPIEFSAACGTLMVRSCPRVSLSASAARRAVAAGAQKHGGILETQGLMVLIDTPLASARTPTSG